MSIKWPFVTRRKYENLQAKSSRLKELGDELRSHVSENGGFVGEDGTFSETYNDPVKAKHWSKYWDLVVEFSKIRVEDWSN